MKNCRAMCKTAPLLMYAFSRKYARKSLLSMGGGASKELIIDVSIVKPVFGDVSPRTGFFRALLRTGMKRSDKLCVLERAE